MRAMPVEMLQLHAGGRGEIIRIGNRLDQGERPQVVVPRNVWQGSHLAAGGKWALLGCTVSPGFEFEDYETRVARCALRQMARVQRPDLRSYARLNNAAQYQSTLLIVAASCFRSSSR